EKNQNSGSGRPSTGRRKGWTSQGSSLISCSCSPARTSYVSPDLSGFLYCSGTSAVPAGFPPRPCRPAKGFLFCGAPTLIFAVPTATPLTVSEPSSWITPETGLWPASRNVTVPPDTGLPPSSTLPLTFPTLDEPQPQEAARLARSRPKSDHRARRCPNMSAP